MTLKPRPNLAGEAWPAPVINLFAGKVGSFIDKTVSFTRPPIFSTNGIIGLNENTLKTNLENKIISPIDLYYTLLGRSIRFSEVDALIRLLGHSVLLEDVTAKALNGILSGNINVKHKKPETPKGGYAGDLSFTSISLAKIAELYEFESATPGNLTGRMSFSGLPKKIESVNGEGFIGLDKADLFYIPIFGPLSPILKNILGHRKTSHEKVRSVSASFVIDKGKVYTNDLSSNTPSASITGDGMIDLKTKEMDLTVRTKTQGLLGFITLPLKPFEKLLQFRGTGSISSPKWSNSPFESTPQYLPEKAEKNKAIIVE